MTTHSQSEVGAGTLPRRRAWLRGSTSRSGGTLAVALMFLPPAVLLFTVFVALPMGEAAWYSFFTWNGYGRPTQFVGWRNFELLFENPTFRVALTNNLLIIVGSLAVQLPLALAMAVLLADRVRGTTTFRLIFFLPYILAEIAAGLIWRFVYDGDYGFLAKIWGAFGATPPYVLAEPELAMYAILVVVIWKYFGFHMILYIAGLQQIDRSLLRGGAHRRRGQLADLPAHHLSAARLDDPAVGVLRDHRFDPAVRPDHAADQGRPLGQHADDGDLPLQLRRHADGDRLRQRRRRRPVPDLRRLRLRLQADADAQ